MKQNKHVKVELTTLCAETNVYTMKKPADAGQVKIMNLIGVKTKFVVRHQETASKTKKVNFALHNQAAKNFEF